MPRCAVLTITIKCLLVFPHFSSDLSTALFVGANSPCETKIDRWQQALSHSMGEAGYEQKKKKVIVQSSTSLLDIISWKSLSPGLP